MTLWCHMPARETARLSATKYSACTNCQVSKNRNSHPTIIDSKEMIKINQSWQVSAEQFLLNCRIFIFENQNIEYIIRNVYKNEHSKSNLLSVQNRSKFPHLTHKRNCRIPRYPSLLNAKYKTSFFLIRSKTVLHRNGKNVLTFHFYRR